MHYEDSSCPLNDLFPQYENQDWNEKPQDRILGTKSKTDGTVKDVSCCSDSLVGINLFDPIKHSSASSVRTLTGISSVFSSFPDSSLSSESDEPASTDQSSEQTGFSRFLAESRSVEEALAPSLPQTGMQDSSKTKASSAKVEEILDDDDHSNDHLKFVYKNPGECRQVQKPPTTEHLTLEDLKAVFHLERPKAEKMLKLKRTTFSNLSRHYGISKWPFRTIRDALNRMEANKRLLDNSSVSKERRRKLMRQQRLLHDVIDLIYKDPRHSRDSNTLAVLLMIVAAKDNQ